MPTLPEFITFTGVDERTSPDRMLALSARYPIEWAILFSPDRQGQADQPRYPSLAFIEELVDEVQELRLAAHLCGEAARQVMDEGVSQHDELLAAHFQRVQVNAREPRVDAITRWARRAAVTPIVQCRGDFPSDERVLYLFDASGGRGIQPAGWPAALPGLCGFAGGISPDNAAQVVQAVGQSAGRYWIDMESGVRGEGDRLDLDRCAAVCQAVFGR